MPVTRLALPAATLALLTLLLTRTELTVYAWVGVGGYCGCG